MMRQMSWEDLRKAFVIMTYFTSWNIDKMAPDQIAAKCLTHVTYAYAKIANGVVVPGDAFTDLQRIIPNTAWVEGAPRNFHGAMQALTHPAGPVAQCNPNLKKLISIGGWTWSGEFSNVAKTPESRTKFANSVVDYIVRHGFDGCELDWEYPVAGGQEGNAVSPDDTLNFVLLLQEIRHRMDLYRIGYGGAPMLLTAATAAGTDLTNNLDIKGMSKILDFFNLMIYDFAGAWENVTAHNSPFNPAFIDTIKNYLDREAPPRQLVAGIPLFGKQFEGARSKGIGVPYDTIKEAISYDEIQDTLVSSDGYEADWDADAKAGFLWNGRKHEFVTYEHPNSSFIKAEYVRRKQLLGVFLWEVSMDRYAVALRKALSAFGLKRSYRECFC